MTGAESAPTSIPGPLPWTEKVPFPEFAQMWAEHEGRNLPPPQLWMAGWLGRAWREGRRDLLLLAFRGSGKSSVAGLFCAWALAGDPDIRILVLAAEDELAAKMVRTVKHVLERHPVCIGLRPPKIELWGADALTVARAGTSRDPSMLAKGIGANFTGSHADIVICDDVEVPNTCATAHARAELRRRLGEITHVLVPGGTVLYIGTPHAADSIYGAEPGPGGAEPFLAGFHRLEIPVEGSRGPVWPEVFGQEEISRIRTLSGPSRFASQMMLKPVPVVAGLLNPELLRRYDAEILYREAGRRPVMELAGRRVVSARAWWDPSLARAGGDASVVAVVFFGAEGDAWLHRIEYLSAGAAEESAQAQCEAVAGLLRSVPVRTLHVEANGVGGFLPQLLRGVLARHGLAVSVCKEVSRAPKAQRIQEGIEARLAAGMLHAHAGVFATPLIAEMRDWRPEGAGPDDGLDALAGCLLAEPLRLPAGKPAPGAVRPPAFPMAAVPHRAEADFTP
ncbi:phage terminase large subunit [Indioceanicola profundi]|uniref:phage terminase large subunit n=1 Tax=Indioceanicola profundi TaxID=2220096 RepID=UPI000E6AA0FE|nr:phage terminase large subunit [Indioceanicola profundi]